MGTKGKVFLAIGLYLLITVVMVILAGDAGKNETFEPQGEFRLEPWIDISIAGIDMSINKAVAYLIISAVATILIMTWIARRMMAKPNRVQMAIELAYDLTRDNITGTNLQGKMATRWFPFIATLFFFLWFCNMIGLVPLPFNTEERIDIFGLEVPAFSLYAATANISVPLALTIVVWFSYHIEGVREHGPFSYLATWLPAGLEDMNAFGKGAIFMIEVVSHFVRLISLSVRLFANILAGHLLLLFMGGGLAVLLGLAALGVLTFPLAFAFYIFEIVIVASLQAFIFSILTAIYLGAAVAESH